MKKDTARPITINLLRRHDQSTFDAVFSWALSVGRLFIIITQFVALAAFGYRIFLDRQIIDLNDSIKDKQAVVKFMENGEKTYRSLQARLGVITKYQNEATEEQDTLNNIVNMARGKMEFTSLTANSEGVSIQGITTSVNLLQRLINDLRAYPGVTSVSIGNIEAQTQGNRIKASISLSFNAVPVIEPLMMDAVPVAE